ELMGHLAANRPVLERGILCRRGLGHGGQLSLRDLAGAAGAGRRPADRHGADAGRDAGLVLQRRQGRLPLPHGGHQAGIRRSDLNSWGTWQRIGQFWNGASFADADWDMGGNFRYATWLAQRARAEGPRTVMVPTPDATLVWYFSGDKVVYLYPTAAIKLAFDVPI